MWILLTVAICLVLPRYMGSPMFIEGIPAAMDWFQTLPFPKLWPRIYWATFKLINYVLVPALCIRFILGAKVLDHGLRIRKEGRIWLLYLAMFLVMLPVTYGISFSDAFIRTYPKYKDAGDTWAQLLIWEGAYGMQFFTLEFFFRGFILFALARYLGAAAIFVMVVPYAMIHFGKPLAETLGSIGAGIVLGTIALRTRSIYGGVALHCAVAWSMDVFALLRKGQLQHLWSD